MRVQIVGEQKWERETQDTMEVLHSKEEMEVGWKSMIAMRCKNMDEYKVTC